ncbi:hypothetical protein M514_10419 [Trichuris suis]|uniref:G-protein coupled receptors family 1 profile domain-containing protein n=1 Tax=Trichuris suis TaxID=68888 RepID=A0A085NIK0_9BILA|nr:hypothetical protein M514_10419 [Trichuris suis]
MDYLYVALGCLSVLSLCIGILHTTVIQAIKSASWIKFLVVVASVAELTSSSFSLLVVLFLEARERSSGCQSRPSAFLAVVFVMCFLLSHAFNIWLWASLASLLSFSSREVTNSASCTLVSHRAAERRVVKTFVAVALICLPIFASHSIVPAPHLLLTVESKYCFIVIPSFFGQLAEGLFLKLIYWSYFFTMLAVPTIALTIYALRYTQASMKLRKTKCIAGARQPSKLTDDPSAPRQIVFAVSLCMAILQVPVVHCMLAAGNDVTLFSLVAQRSRFVAIFTSFQLVCFVPPICYLSFSSLYRKHFAKECCCFTLALNAKFYGSEAASLLRSRRSGDAEVSV